MESKNKPNAEAAAVLSHARQWKRDIQAAYEAACDGELPDRSHDEAVREFMHTVEGQAAYYLRRCEELQVKPPPFIRKQPAKAVEILKLLET